MPLSPRLLRPRAAAAAATGFDPRAISGLTLWLDASVDSSLTFNGNNVSEWRDLSGNARHYSQSTAANQPNGVSRTRNNRRVLDFTPVQYLAGNTAALNIARNVNGVTLFMAAQYDATAVAGGMYAFMQSRSDNIASARIAFGVTSFIAPSGSPTGTGFTALGRRNDSDSFAGATALPDTNPHVFGATYDYANTTARVFVDGVNAGSNTSWLTSGNTPDTASLGSGIGSDPIASGGIGMDGFIGEMVIYHRVLSASERQAVQSYLGAKWGITVT